MVSSFPGLIAAAHVLHHSWRQGIHRALRLLTRKNTFYCRYGVFKVRAGSRPTRRPARTAVSQNSTAWNRPRSTLFPGEPAHRRSRETIDGTDAYRSKSSDIP